MAQIFISYKKEDHERIKPLAQALEAQGFDVWWDRELLVGAKWEKKIAEELEKARCIIVAWSKLAVDSDWVKDEARFAYQANRLVPILLEPVKIPFGFGGIQTGDFSTWHGGTNEPQFQQLCLALRTMLGSPEPKPVPPPVPILDWRKVRAAALSILLLVGGLGLLWQLYPADEIDSKIWNAGPPDRGYCFQRERKVEEGDFIVRCFSSMKLCKTQWDNDKEFIRKSDCALQSDLRRDPQWSGAKRGILGSWYIYATQELSTPFPQLPTPATPKGPPSTDPKSISPAEPQQIARRNYKFNIIFAGFNRDSDIAPLSRKLQEIGWDSLPPAQAGGPDRDGRAAGLREVRYADPNNARAAGLLVEDLAKTGLVTGTIKASQVSKIDPMVPGLPPLQLQIWIGK